MSDNESNIGALKVAIDALKSNVEDFGGRLSRLDDDIKGLSWKVVYGAAGICGLGMLLALLVFNMLENQINGVADSVRVLESMDERLAVLEVKRDNDSEALNRIETQIADLTLKVEGSSSLSIPRFAGVSRLYPVEPVELLDAAVELPEPFGLVGKERVGHCMPQLDLSCFRELSKERVEPSELAELMRERVEPSERVELWREVMRELMQERVEPSELAAVMQERVEPSDLAVVMQKRAEPSERVELWLEVMRKRVEPSERVELWLEVRRELMPERVRYYRLAQECSSYDSCKSIFLNIQASLDVNSHSMKNVNILSALGEKHSADGNLDRAADFYKKASLEALSIKKM